jgi:hypothetical protein
VRFRSLVCLLFAGLAWGQVAAPAPNPEVQKSASSAEATVSNVQVGPNDPVITINDFCPSGVQPDGSCKTIITRAQFDSLAEALQPDMSLPLRLKVANNYAQIVRMAATAEKRGLDQTPAFAEEMRYARMQLLSQDLTHALQVEANRISDAELLDYYKKNESSFEEATVARIFVPHTKQAVPHTKQVARPSAEHDAVASSSGPAATVAPKTTAAQQGEAQQNANVGAMTKLAADLRARAVNGEDLDKLQTEAYAAAGIPEVAANTRMEHVRRNTLPPQHESVMDLEAGEVSPVFSDPGGAHFIYKMVSKSTLTLEDAKPEIRALISAQRFRDSMKPFEGNAIFDDAYFNPPGATTTTPHRNLRNRRKKPPVESDQDRN